MNNCPDCERMAKALLAVVRMHKLAISVGQPGIGGAIYARVTEALLPTEYAQEADHA